MCLWACAKCSDSDLTHACAVKSDLGICSPLIHSTVSNDSVSEQWLPWSDCAMRSLIWAFPVRISRRNVFAWCGPFRIKKNQITPTPMACLPWLKRTRCWFSRKFLRNSSDSSGKFVFLFWSWKCMLCIRIASLRRFSWVHLTHLYFIEDQKNTLKLSPFVHHESTPI